MTPQQLTGSLILGAILLSAALAQAESYYHNGKEVTKLSAIKQLINEPSAQIMRCNDVMLTDKATLKNRPKTK